MDETPSSTVLTSLDEIMERVIEKFAFYLTITASVAYPVSISRAFDMGWLPIFSLHTICFLVIIVTSLIRKKIRYQVELKIYLLLGVAIAGPGIYSFGFFGVGVFVALVCPLLCLFYMDKKFTILIACLMLATYLFCAYSFIWGGHELPFRESDYISSISGWATILVAAIIFFGIFGVSTAYLQKQLTQLLVRLEYKNIIIQQQKQQIEHLVNHDTLTGLLSLRGADVQLDLILKQANEKQHHSALLFLDLDGFKAINDTHGHDAGDLVLQAVGERIKSSIRAVDKACRIGGDEFLIIVSKFEKPSEITKLCKRLIDVICLPVQYNDVGLLVSCSIGAASYPSSAKDAISLRIKADESMYKVKKTGKNNFLIAEGELTAVAT